MWIMELQKKTDYDDDSMRFVTMKWNTVYIQRHRNRFS